MGIARYLFSISIVALLTGCSGGVDSQATTGTLKPGWPTELKMAFQPSEDDVERRMQEDVFNQLSSYLSTEIGIPVKVIRTTGYGPTIEAMRAKKIDFGRSGGSFTYLIANQKAGAEAIVTRGTSTGPGIYSSIIATSPATGIRSLEDLRSRQRDLVFAFVDPASTSGHLIPRSGLESNGIDPDNFKQTIFTMSHTNSAMTLTSAKVDVGGMSRSTYERLIEAGRIKPEDLVILWESKPIPTGPIIVREGLPQELKDRIQAAYLKLNEGGTLMDALRHQSGVEDLRYFAATDQMWDGLREIAYSVDSMKLLGSG